MKMGQTMSTKSKILRNIALISALFAIVFAVMLVTNYFQVRGSNPLQSEVAETLKKLNDEHAGNPELLEQIRQLDLLSRKAYFISEGRLKAGFIILLVMLGLFLLSTRLYFAEDKDIPGKEIDPVDEWIVKSRARKYLQWIAAGLGVAALAAVFFTSPYLKNHLEKEPPLLVAEVFEAADSLVAEREEAAIPADTVPASIAPSVVVAENRKPADSVEISKVTHNGFRGNYGSAISAAKKVPVKWNLASGDKILWKADIPRKGYSSPVINGNKVFVTGGDDEARELYCYELGSGKLLWKLAADNIPGSPSKMPETTDDTGLSASTAATNGKQVCAIFATGDIIGADMEGKRLWAKNLGVPDNHYGYASSLLAFGNAVIIQYHNANIKKIISLDMATGNERWSSQSTNDKIAWSSPIIAYVGGKPQLIVMGTPAVTSYNPSNGEQNWRVEGLSGEVAASPCASGGIVFAASEYAKLIAIDAAAGEVLWEADEYLPEIPSPVATRENLFVVTSDGTIAVYDTKTGELKATKELAMQISSSPVISEGKLYLIGEKGKVYVLSATPNLHVVSSFDTGEKNFATPAFTDGKVVVRTENTLYCAKSD